MKKQGISFQMKIFLIGFFLILLIPVEASPEEPAKALKLLQAVEKTITQQPSIRIQKQEVRISKGVLQEARGQFDPTIGTDISRASERTPLTEANKVATGRSQSERNLTTYNLSLNKQLRTGIILSPNVQMTRTDDLSFGGETTNEASVNFAVIFPLLKGRGIKATGARELAAETGLEASELDLRHTISASILETGIAYWNVLAARKNLVILKETELRARKLVRDVEELVEADERPSSDLDQLQANLASKTEARITGEQDIYEARQNLGIAMGLPFNEIDALPPPVDHFPETLSDEALSVAYDKKRFIQLSMQHRADLMASKKREEAAKILLTAARLNQKPQLDLTFNLGYKGLDEGDSYSGYYDSLYENTSGLNAYAIINYQYPLGNNTSKGLLQQRKSSYQQTRVRTADLDRNIRSDVAVALQALIRSISELQETRKSVSYYQKAVDNEKLKLQMGMSTVIDVVTMEDRLRNALLSEVSAQQRYSSTLLQLRFATGTIVSIEKEQCTVRMEQLTRIPTLERNS